MTAYMDANCERTAPGLLNEPLNAITSLLNEPLNAITNTSRNIGITSAVALCCRADVVGVYRCQPKRRRAQAERRRHDASG